MKKLLVLVCMLAMLIALIPVASAQLSTADLYEAENGSLTGVTVASIVSGYSGSGYVTGFDASTDSLTITVNAPQQALYDLTIGYRSESGDKYTKVSLNGSSLGEVFLPITTVFSETSGGRVLLNAGSNQITFENHWGYYDIDYIKVHQAAINTTHPIERTLVNPNASPQAVSLFNYLADQYGQSIVSGQQNNNDNLSHVSWIESTTGKKPAVVGFDLMDYSPSRVANGAISYEIEHALAWDAQGGIVTFLWHWNAPTKLNGTCDWWSGFYTDCSDYDIAYALANPNSEDYQLLIQDMDAIAVELKRLEDAQVPVLFRPLHEAEGGWFWWGAKGPEPAKQLWRLMYDRYTSYHQIDNLIWVWNSISPDWYPGDDVVDIVSADDYAAAGDYGPVYSKYESLVSLVNDTKMVALTENGPIPDPDLLQIYGAHWRWFSTWTGNYLTDGNNNSTSHLIDVYNHPYVITLDELPDIKNYQSIPDNEAPTAPSNLMATVASSSHINLSWTASTDNVDVSGYKVYRNDIEVGSSTTTSYSDTDLAASTTYSYMVKAYDAAGNLSAVSNTASATTSAGAMTMQVEEIAIALHSGKGKTWAVATVLITDDAGNPVANATVSGHWSGVTSDSDSGMTGADGIVTLSSNQVNNPGKGTYSFTVDNVTYSTLTYDPSQNIETSDSITK